MQAASGQNGPPSQPFTRPSALLNNSSNPNSFRPGSAAGSSSGNNAGGSGTPQVKAEPVEARFSNTLPPPLPNVGGYATSFGAHPGMPGPPPGLALPPLRGIPPLGSMPGYGPIPPLGSSSNHARDVLMLNRGAPPYGGPRNMNEKDKIPPLPQVDGSSASFHHGKNRAVPMYSWMNKDRLERIRNSELLLPQLDGPSSQRSDSNTPSLRQHSLPGASSDVPPPLAMNVDLPPPLSLSMGDLPPPLKLETPPTGTMKLLSESNLSMKGGNSSFARNPNVAALPTEDINSDLDDSDEEDVGGDPNGGIGVDPAADVTYCTYDKVRQASLVTSCGTDKTQVTRVKTKWKVVFRDGMVHANGKDYLFGRCTG